MRKRLASQTNNFEDIDKNYAYSIWLAEKDFNVGPITESFLLLKFWNLFDDYNIKTYNQSVSGRTMGKKGTVLSGGLT